jgi:hypothetical protein
MPPPQPPARVTDDEGRFTFERLRPGRYRLTVQKSGFAPELPMANAVSRPPVEIAAGQVIDLGDVAIERGGAIAGRVLDTRGEPVADVRVTALRRLPRDRAAAGPPMIPAGGGSQTNDLGEFRIFGLAAGEYLVAAVPQSRGGGTASNASSVPATTFFPGTADADAATAISVTNSQSTAGIELRLVSVPAYRVSGIVIDGNGNPAAGAIVLLMPERRQLMPFLGAVSGNARSAQDGTFALGGVPAGTYRATATQPLMPSGGGIGTFSSVSAGIGGAPSGTEVVVADGNVTGVRIVVQGR